MGKYGITIRSIDELYRVAQMAVAAGIVPRGDDAATVAAKMQVGLEVGFPPMMSLAVVAIVNGRASLHSDAGPALLLRSGLQEGAHEVRWSQPPPIGTPLQEWPDGLTCTVTLHRRGMGPFVGSFSVAQAKAAGLWMKRSHNGRETPWITTPDVMLFRRGYWRAARMGFADVLGGLLPTDEALDLHPREVEIEPSPAPAAGGTKLDRLTSKLAARAAPPAEAPSAAQDPAEVEIARPAPGASWEAWTSKLAARAAGRGSERAPEPTEVSPAPGASWEAWEGQRVSVAFRVNCGPWEDWADMPHGLKLLEKRKVRTWRQAAAGSLDGLRRKVLAGIVEGAGAEPDALEQFAACALALLLASGAARAELDDGGPEAEVDPEIERRALAEGHLFDEAEGAPWATEAH